MPGNAPAVRRALERAGLSLSDMLLSKLTIPLPSTTFPEPGLNIPLEKMNHCSSLIWGHPQAPMGTRAIIELIEELAQRGGGFGLFTGCAAGDSAMAVVLEVSGG
jgi:acetyl-CoA acetyltransferase